MEDLAAIISAHPFFRTMQARHVATVAEGATLAEFEVNQVILREHDVACHCYLIQEGRVALETHVPGCGAMIVQTLGDGEALGWSWLFPPFLLHFQARALSRTRAIRLHGAHLLIACEQDHDFGYELMKRVSQLLISRMQATRRQLLEVHGQLEVDPPTAR
ncbi:MAG: Crp/Fnr family transcriptional regulator [Verrucomicrobiae bacterium]|nr:Crp/Fnr family transcriptional regulator [Verrucomicrobiae bacterium]